MSKTLGMLVLALCAAAWASPAASAQQPKAKAEKASAKKPAPAEAAPAEVDPMAEIRRTTAISLVNTLADEARTFREPLLRSRVQARAADALWDTDRERARTLFRRAWDEAEAADAEADRRVDEERRRQMRERGNFSIQLPPSVRTEVLRLAARRDRELGEEFLTKLEEARKREAENAADKPEPGQRDPGDVSAAIAKRLQLAIQLLQDGDVERATQFADPALGSVSMPALQFLARLRTKNAKAADDRYAAMLARAALDPASDANTASLLASYIFSPPLYMTFTRDAGSNSNSWGNAQSWPPPSDISPQLRAQFFRAAASLLLRPTPTPDQDRTTSGRAGWYMVIARLLPLFDQFAPSNSAALRAKLSSLAADTPEGIRRPGNNALTRGLVPEDPNRDRLQETLGRLERARTAEERDAVYVDAVFDAMRQKDARVEEFLNKIEDSDLRKRLRSYIDFESARAALNDKETAEALRLARGGTLTSIQSTWVLTEVARLLAKTEPGRAVGLLDEALTEAKERMDAASPERVSALSAIATQLAEIDRARAWEVMLEVVKASNSARGYTGEDGRLAIRLQTKNMNMTSSNSAQSFDLNDIFAKLAREDLQRSIDLARGFDAESPRAVATLAIARAVLEKNK